jgi:hypothetical protein
LQVSRPKTIAILQSNYVPWKGYFDIMAAADEFLIFDEVQFTKNDWRNRNQIVLNGRKHWLTIPVKTSGAFGERIDQIESARPDWPRAHWDTLRQAYGAAPFHAEMAPFFEALYRDAASLRRLTEINELFLRRLATLLDLPTAILRADIVPRGAADPTGRLVEICRARGATDYISGPVARAYLKPDRLSDAGVRLHYANYQGYPEYKQSMTPFDHGVSILDTLFRCGPAARAQLKSLRERRSFLDPG